MDPGVFFEPPYSPRQECADPSIDQDVLDERSRISAVLSSTSATLQCAKSGYDTATSRAKLAELAVLHLPVVTASLSTLRDILSKHSKADHSSSSQPKRKRAEEQDFHRAKKLHQQAQTAIRTIERLESKLSRSRQKRKQYDLAVKKVRSARRTPCYFYKHGACKNGTACPFRHEGNKMQFTGPQVGSHARGHTVRWNSNGSQPYGFIADDDTGIEYYCPKSSLQLDNDIEFPIPDGIAVSFTIQDRPDPTKSHVATDVKILF